MYGQADRQAGRWIVRQIDRQTDRQVDRQTWQTCRHMYIERQTGVTVRWGDKETERVSAGSKQ